MRARRDWSFPHHAPLARKSIRSAIRNMTVPPAMPEGSRSRGLQRYSQAKKDQQHAVGEHLACEDPPAGPWEHS